MQENNKETGYLLCKYPLLLGSYLRRQAELSPWRAQNDLAGAVGQPGKAAAPHKNDKKAAFTLAEVLITLGIIGIVAAMTLPALIQGQQKKALETALHKNYSIISQALEAMNADVGETVNTNTFAGTDFKKNFIKYFKTAKDCKNSGCAGYDGDADVDLYITKHYRNYNNTNYVSVDYMDDGQFMLGDGSMIYIEHGGGVDSLLLITVDVNGIKKGPNRYGQDLFTFQILKNGKLMPMGGEGTIWRSAGLCNTDSANKMNGAGCTYRALTDKSYWKDLPK